MTARPTRLMWLSVATLGIGFVWPASAAAAQSCSLHPVGFVDKDAPIVTLQYDPELHREPRTVWVDDYPVATLNPGQRITVRRHARSYAYPMRSDVFDLEELIDRCGPSSSTSTVATTTTTTTTTTTATVPPTTTVSATTPAPTTTTSTTVGDGIALAATPTPVATRTELPFTGPHRVASVGAALLIAGALCTRAATAQVDMRRQGR